MKKTISYLSIMLLIGAVASCKKKKEEEPVPVVNSSQATFKYKVNGVSHTSLISFAQNDSTSTYIYGGDHISGNQVLPPAIEFLLPRITGPKSFSLDTILAYWMPNDTTVSYSYQGNINVTAYNQTASGSFYFDAIRFATSGLDTVHITEGSFANVHINH